jgi:glutamate receptor, ionotropic, invertebrate
MLKTPKLGQNLTGNDKFEGYCVDLMERLSKSLNITYEIRLVKDGKFGSKSKQIIYLYFSIQILLFIYLDAQGHWSGIVGELVRREADIGVASLTISMVRETAIDFSAPFMNLGISIMVFKQKQAVIYLFSSVKFNKYFHLIFNLKKPSLFSFMEPLSYYIWVCILLVIYLLIKNDTS